MNQLKTVLSSRAFYIAFIMTLCCSLIGKYAATLPILSVIGAMVIALLLGMLLQLVPRLKDLTDGGVGFISGKFIRLGIILLGFKLNLMLLAQSGIKTITVAAIIVTLATVLTYVLARRFGVTEELALLAGSGCGVCGAAAVMGVSPQVKAKPDDSVLGVAVICILGTVFTLIVVLLQPFLHLSPEQYGVLSGASLHEIAYAVAAAGGYQTTDPVAAKAAMDIALITKLSRVLLLAPTAILVGLFYQKVVLPKRDNSGEAIKAKTPIPWFMAGFLATSALGTFVLAHFGEQVQPLLTNTVSLGYIVLGMAMAALGYSVNFRVIVKRGSRIFAAAIITSIVLFVVALALAKLWF